MVDDPKVVKLQPKPRKRTVGDVLSDAARQCDLAHQTLIGVNATDKLDVRSVQAAIDMLDTARADLVPLIPRAPTGGKFA